MSEGESLVIEHSLPLQRLDVYLRHKFPELSRAAIQRLLQQGNIQVDGKIVKPTHHPRAGEKVSIRLPEPAAAVVPPQEMPLDVLFEDQDLIVLNKPAGVVVHPAAGHPEHTLVNALLYHCRGQLSGIGGVARPGIVHRLDKDTSGCLVVAKNDTAHLELSQAFARRATTKVYQAIVCGRLMRTAGEIEAALGRHPTQRQKMAVVKRGRAARTQYQTIDRNEHASWLEVVLHTGRTHQIRVHLAHLGHPVAGDLVYGRRGNARLKEFTGYAAPRQMLHAWRLSFCHPRTGEALGFEAPLPDDFSSALEFLRFRKHN